MTKRGTREDEVSLVFVLDPKSVRKVAAQVKGCYEIKNHHHHLYKKEYNNKQKKKKGRQNPPQDDDSMVLSFMSKDDSVRVNVYCETGTVGICHVLNGEVREIFRPNCSLERVGRILRDPPELTPIDISLKDDDDDDDETSENEKMLHDLELTEIGIAILMGEVNSLEQHLDNLLQTSSSQQKGKNHSPSSPKGTKIQQQQQQQPKKSNPVEFVYCLPQHTVSQVEGCIEESSSSNDGDPIHCVATNGSGTIILHDSGDYTYTCDIPANLQSILEEQEEHPSTRRTTPTYVSLGSEDRFYIEFSNGSAFWDSGGSTSLDQVLLRRRKNGKKIQSVAFGSDDSSYFVVWEDGCWELEGDGIPEGLIEKLEERNNRDDVTCVTLGPDGEWFLQARNGRQWWGNVPDDLNDTFDTMEENGYHQINFVVFGECNSYFMSVE